MSKNLHFVQKSVWILKWKPAFHAGILCVNRNDLILFPFRIYEIEKKIHTPEKFRFPAFETTNWYAARSIANDMREMNNMGLKCPLTLLHGVKALIMTLKQWNQDKDVSIENI
jgi:hypothetical protein